MANSAPALRAGAAAPRSARATADELFEQIPADHRLTRPLELPPRSPPRSSCAGICQTLRAQRRLRGDAELPRRRLLAAPRARGLRRDRRARPSSLTPVWGTPSSDHGRNQAWFEFASQLGELLEHGLRRPAGLQLGLRRRPRDPHGRAHRPAAARCWCPRSIDPGAAGGDPQLLRAAGDGGPHRRDARRLRPGHRRARPRRSRAASSPTGPPRSISRTPPTSA